MNKKIKPGIAIGIILFLAIFVGCLSLLGSVNQQANQTQPTIPISREQEKTSQPDLKKQSLTLKPSYKTGELLTFTHLAQGFSINYPAGLTPEIRGAEEGNFFLEIGDENGKSSIVIYPKYPKQDVSKIDLNNVAELSYDFFNGDEKIIPSEEKIIAREQINIGGVQAYKIISNAERIIIPQKKNVLIIEIQNKKIAVDLINKIINSFSFIPSIPNDWKLYEDSEIGGFRIKYPANCKIKKKENYSTQSYDVTFVDSKGDITFSFYNNASSVRQYFSSADRYLYNIETAIGVEQFLNEDISNAKFNQNAFSFQQGGDSAIRVVHPEKNDFNLYFYLFSFPSIKINAPSKLESVVNQMLMSLNEEYNKYNNGQ